MEEIKVGEYVRTKQGYIAKLEEITDEFMWFDNIIYNNYEETTGLHLTEKYGVYNQKNDIKKHSLNLIDLIEEGDYVNGKEVAEIGKDKTLYYNTDGSQLFTIAGISEDIKSIVTKEMMKSVEYRVV